jgi:hypothetical protein
MKGSALAATKKRKTYYRNGVKRDEEWTYSVQACKEEFLAKYLYQNVLEKCLSSHTSNF